MTELCTEFLKSQEVSVKTTTTNLVATWFCDYCTMETRQKRTNHQHTASKRSTLLYELIALQVVEMKIGSTESIVVWCVLPYFDTHVNEQFYEIVHIENVGNISYIHFL